VEDTVGGPLTKMPTKLKDTLEKVRKLDNKSNSDLLIKFYDYLRDIRTSERYQSDILKVLVKFSEFVDDNLMNVKQIKYHHAHNSFLISLSLTNVREI
jgi:hypothetical protein